MLSRSYPLPGLFLGNHFFPKQVRFFVAKAKCLFEISKGGKEFMEIIINISLEEIKS